jgi:hypothetical protein
MRAQLLPVLLAPGEKATTGPGCWRDALRVPPGGTLDVFETDAGIDWLGYCGVSIGGPDPDSDDSTDRELRR